MLTKERVRKLKDVVRELVAAEVLDSWKGSRDPDDFPHIESRLKAARERYREFLASVADGVNT